jgi:plasmid stabilization system protein ParE
MRHEFHPEALAEYEAAAVYYAERDPRVGQRFVAAVEDTIDKILDAPTRWRVLDEDVRRCLTRVFPYGVLYTIEPDFVLIVGVMHCSRQPGYWKRRIAKP